MRISDWSSDVCSSDLFTPERTADLNVYDKVADHLSDERRKGRRTIIASYSAGARERLAGLLKEHGVDGLAQVETWQEALGSSSPLPLVGGVGGGPVDKPTTETRPPLAPPASGRGTGVAPTRSAEHTSQLQSLMRISYDLIC